MTQSRRLLYKVCDAVWEALLVTAADSVKMHEGLDVSSATKLPRHKAHDVAAADIAEAETALKQHDC